MKGLMIFHARVWEQLDDKSWVSKAAERHDTVRRVELAKELNCDYIFSRHFGGGYSSEKEHEHRDTNIIECPPRPDDENVGPRKN